MTDSYYLKVMGAPMLLDPFGRRVRFRVRKHLALLVYFTLEGRPTYRRDHLVELLWPRANGKGSQSLSMAFSVLRAEFGRDSTSNKKDIAQFNAPPIVTDLQRLQHRELPGTEIDAPLEVDGLLQDFDIEDAPGFQHWVDRKRAEYLPAIKAAMVGSIEQARRTGDYAAMQTLADRLLSLDHLAEQGIAARMEAFALAGDRLAALRLYETWKRELQEQLSAAPSRELEGLAARLRKRALAPPALSTAHPTEPQRDVPFVGRSAEYRVLFEAWEETNQSKSTHVLIAGESGIGKSTLVLRFGAAVSLAGAAVARVQCFELEQRIAFGMMGALVTELLDRPGVAGTAPESLAEVARIVPKVWERFPNLPAPRNTEGEAARLHFAEGTFALFDAIMEEQPLVLIVDDYPRSDEASLSVLHLLLRRSENRRLMVLLGGRPPSPEDPPQAARIRRAVEHLPIRHIDLQALTESESEELLHSLLRGAEKQPGAPERRAILRTAAGNPMALELLVRDWERHPDAPLAMLLTAMRSEVRGAALGAEEYDQLIGRILPGLGARDRLALFLAVILGPRLNDFGYFACADLTPPQVMAALSELVECRILRSTERGLEFVNEVMRARLYLKIPVATRVRLHDGVATLLMEAMGRGEPVSRLEIAWHCIRAKRRDEAAPHLITGARQSLTKGAPDDAARALSTALKELKGQTWQEASLLLAEAYHEIGDQKGTLEILNDLRETTPTDPMVFELAEELEIDARYRLGLIPLPEAIEIVRQFITSLRNRTTQAGIARAALASVRVAREISDSTLFDQLQETLERLPIESYELRERAMTLLAQAMLAFHRRDIERSIRVAKNACEFLEKAGSQDMTLLSLTMGLGALSVAKGDYEEAIRPYELTLSLARRLGNESQIATAAGNLSMTYFRMGNYGEQRKWALVARKFRDKTLAFDRVRTAGFWGIAAVKLGLRDEAEEALTELRHETSLSEPRYVVQWGSYYTADLLWLLERRNEALDAALSGGAGEQEWITPALIGEYSRWSCLVSARGGKSKRQLMALLALRERRHMLDALDRAELDCAVIYLCKRSNFDCTPYLLDCRAALAGLPTSATHMLAALGLLLDHS